MPKAEFDRYASSYRDQHKESIALTGEEPAYFADYKMRDFQALVDEYGLPLSGIYLDFGSGIGSSIAPFKQHLPAAKLVCTDVSEESLDLSKAAHGNTVEYALIERESLPFADMAFDGIFAFCVFHHIPPARHDVYLREIRRVLKPGGLLMIYEHNPLNPLTVQAVRNCPFDENAILIRAGELKKRCADAGFIDGRIDYRVYFPAALSGLRGIERYLRKVPLGAQYSVALRR